MTGIRTLIFIVATPMLYHRADSLLAKVILYGHLMKLTRETQGWPNGGYESTDI